MPELLVNALLFAAGVAALLVGGDLLVRGAVGVAVRLRVSPIFIGLTVVAFGTSAPELALNVSAALNDNTGLSFGNVIGSNVANIGLILGVSALLRPLPVLASVIKREIPMMIAATALAIALIYAPPAADGSAHAFARFDGAILLVGFVLFSWAMARAMRAGPDAAIAREAEDLSSRTAGGASTGLAVAQLLGGLALLVGGGYLAEMGAVQIARGLQVSEALIGATIVAVATSLPELATSIMAARRGQTDIAVGNIVGSNIFNLLLIMGTTATIRPVPAPEGAVRSVVVMAVLSLLLTVLARTRDRTVSRAEGLLLLAIYAGWLASEALSIRPEDAALVGGAR